MAKKKTEKKAEKKEGYTPGRWQDKVTYQCDYCPFDSLHEDVIKEHIFRAHTALPPRPKLEKPLFDRFGNKLEN